MVHPKDHVSPTVVTDATRRKDFLRAGLAWKDQEGRIRTEDAEGRVITSMPCGRLSAHDWHGMA